MPKKEITTIATSTQFSDKIERAAKANRQSKKDYLESLFSYVERFGINPNLHEPPLAEIEKMTKRLDQVIKFIKVQEKEILTPAVESVLRTKQSINESLEQVKSDTILLRKGNSKIYEEQVKIEKSVQVVLANQSQLVDFVKKMYTEMLQLKKDVAEMRAMAKENKGITIKF